MDVCKYKKQASGRDGFEEIAPKYFQTQEVWMEG
jgi:hypothetical protein